jgi:hypothetical protein
MRESQVRMYWLILLAATAFAQDTGSVRGVVTSITGEPLRKAIVQLQSMPAKFDGSVLQTTTDSAGAFAFEAVPVGNYVATARRNGYLESGPKARGVTMQKGKAIADLVLKLTPQSVVTGRVVDEDGDPMAGAAVSLMRESFLRGRRAFQVQVAQTNDLGEYRIAGLQAGRFLVMAEARGGQNMTKGPSYVPTYFPGVTSLARGTVVDLQPGQTLGNVDVRMLKVPTYTIKGRAAPNTSLALTNAAAPQISVMAGGDGSFRFTGVPDGTYTLVGNGFAVPVQVASRDVEDVIVAPAEKVQVSGIVRADDPGDIRNVRVTLDPLDAFPLDMISSRTVAEGGTFAVTDVVPARYAVDVFGAPEGYYVKSVQWSGQDVTDSGIGVSGNVQTLEIVLAKGAANIEGSVDTPLAVVAVVPPPSKRQRWSLYKTVMAGSTGKFAVRNLPPGDYTVVAFPPGSDPSILQNPELSNQIGSRGVTVTVGGTASESVKLKVVE